MNKFLKLNLNSDRHDDKTCEACRIKYKYYDCFLEYTNLKMISYNANVCFVTKIINNSLMKS